MRVMKALTLHAPWAWAICYLGKDIENRTWQPPASMIGQRIAIHAGSAAMWTPAKWWKVFKYTSTSDAIRANIARVFKCSEKEHKAERDRFCSAIVATAVIAEVIPPQDTDAGWYVAGHYGWILTDVRVLAQPVPVARGMLGLWDMTPEQEAAVVAAGRLQ